jgi:hypothetical protein
MCLLIQLHLFLWYLLAIMYPLLPVSFSWLKLQNMQDKSLYFVNSFSS